MLVLHNWLLWLFPRTKNHNSLIGLTHSNFAEFSTLFSNKNHRTSTKIKSHKSKVELSIDIFCLPSIKSWDSFLNIILKQTFETQKKSQNLDRRILNQYFACHEIALHISPNLTTKALGSKHDFLLLSQIEDLHVELQRKEQEQMQPFRNYAHKNSQNLDKTFVLNFPLHERAKHI